MLDLAVAPAGRARGDAPRASTAPTVTRVERPDDRGPTRRSGATRTAPSTWCRRRDGSGRRAGRTADVVVVDLPGERARGGGARRASSSGSTTRHWSTRGCRRTRRRARPPTCRTTSSCCGRGPASPRSNRARRATTRSRRSCRSSPTSRARSARPRSAAALFERATHAARRGRSRCRGCTRSTR